MSAGALLQDGAGKIAGAAITVSEFSADAFAPAIQNVLRALPDQVSLDVVTDAGTRERVESWLVDAGRQSGSTIYLAEHGLDYSLWIQDPLLLRQDGSASVSDAFERYRDKDIALFLRIGAGWPAAKASIQVDGGNVITHGHLVLVGLDAEADSAALEAFDPSRKVVRIGTAKPCSVETSRQTDRPLPGWTEVLDYLSAEGTHQPIFHIDHMIAPAGFVAGRPRFLVGCPRMGAQIIGHPLWPHAQPNAFDEIAGALHANGAFVLRVPQPLAWVDRPERNLRRWFYLPVNNVLIDGGSVLLPGFANEAWPELEALDNANVALWRDLGFDVVLIPEMMALAEAMGGPRCMVKVTARN